MEKLLQDIRFGIRQLLKKPGFAALAITSMALGIGANTSIFSLIDTVLLRPLAVHEPGQLRQIYGTANNGKDVSTQSYLNYKDYRDRNTVMSGMVAYRIVVSSLSHAGTNHRVWGYLVSGNYFDVLGVKPALGRAFLPEEDQAPGSGAVTVLSHGCWERRFGSNPAIIGQTVQFNGQPFTVIGVAPKGFIGTEVAYAPEMFVPITMATTIEPGARWLESRTSDNLFMVGRLKPGMSEAQAQAGLETLTAQLAQEYPEKRRARCAHDGAGAVPAGDPEFGLRVCRCALRGRRAGPPAGVRESRQSPPGARDRAAEGDRGAARRRRQPDTSR
jgi:hypothetical protein